MTDDTTEIDERTLEDAAAKHVEAEKKKTPTIEFLSDDELWGQDLPDESLVSPALGIAYGPPALIVGASFVGKTLIAVSMGIAIAGGRPIWGRYAAKPGTFVLLDHEQGKPETKKRIQRIAMGLGLTRADLAGKLKVSIFPAVNLTTARAIDEYVRIMTGARLLVIDSLKAITPGVEENSSSLRDLIRVLTAASERTKCAVVVIHHAGKGDDEDPRGSSAIRDEASTIYSVTGSDRRTKTVRNSKNRPRAELTPDFGLAFREPDAERMIDPVPDAEDGFGFRDVPPPLSPLVIEVASLDGNHRERIVTWLTEHGGRYEGTRNQFINEIGGARQSMLTALRELEESGRVNIAARPPVIRLQAEGEAPAPAPAPEDDPLNEV